MERLPHVAMGLAEEAGEVAGVVKKSQYNGRGLDLERLEEEAGDALWYLTQVADTLGMTLAELAYSNIKKLHARHPGKYPHPDELRGA